MFPAIGSGSRRSQQSTSAPRRGSRGAARPARRPQAASLSARRSTNTSTTDSAARFGSNSNVVRNSSAYGAAAMQAHLMKGLKMGLSRVDRTVQVERQDPYTADSQLSLAQRMGLVQCPPKALTEDEWSVAKEKSRKRQDSQEPCPICCEDFKQEDQVILSCSHVFHAACLANWERHSGVKNCPVCRQAHYEKRTTSEGAAAFYQKCVLRVQAVCRGFIARRRAHRMLMEIRPEVKRDFVGSKLTKASARLVGCIDARERDLDDFFAELDQSVAQARIDIHGPVERDWAAITQQALARGDSECAICLGNVDLCSERHGRHAVVLSCSHVFHAKCIDSFERFSTTEQCVCPVCRSAYDRHHLCDPFEGDDDL